MKQIDESIARYLSQIASADRQDNATSQQTSERLEGKISKLKDEINRLKAVGQVVLNTPDQQISLTAEEQLPRYEALILPGAQIYQE